MHCVIPSFGLLLHGMKRTVYLCMHVHCGPTHVAKTRDLEWEALLAIEEKLRLMEQSSPVKPLDESMVEFLRSQISNNATGGIEPASMGVQPLKTPVPQHGVRASATFTGYEGQLVTEAANFTQTNASAGPFLKDPEIVTTLFPDSPDLSSRLDGRKQDEDAGDDIPPPLPSSPPPDASAADDSSSDDGVDNVDVDDLVVCKLRTAVFANGREKLLSDEQSYAGLQAAKSLVHTSGEWSGNGNTTESLEENITWHGTPGHRTSYGTPYTLPGADQNGNIRHDGESQNTFSREVAVLEAHWSWLFFSACVSPFWQRGFLLQLWGCAHTCVSFVL